MKELAGEVDPDDYVGFEKDIASSMPTVDAGSISAVRKLKKKSLYNTGAQLTRLWMYQAMKTLLKRLKILKESSSRLGNDALQRMTSCQ